MTAAEWAALPEDIEGELVDGRLVEEEMPDNVHEEVVRFLIVLLSVWALPRGGFVLPSGATFRTRARRGRRPDVSVYLSGVPAPPRRGVNRRPPEIAVEVLSPTPSDRRRDRVEKLDEYAQFGVCYYWIIDPEARSLEVFARDEDGRYVLVVAATDGQLTSVPGCDGLTIDLDALWASVDRLGPPEDEDEADEG